VETRNNSKADVEADAAGGCQGMAELQRKLKELAGTRPEKLEAARSVISNVNYPPEELLKGIAQLLAIHLEE
jgi:hypothetical protein